MEPNLTPPTATVKKADLLKRFLAKLIDGIIAAVLFWVVVAIIPGLFFAQLMGAIVAGAYWLLSDGLEVEFMKHRSLGKKLIGLDVVRLDGAPMDMEASARRNWMFAIGYFSYPFPAFIGLLVALAGLAIFVYEVYKVVTESDGRRWGDELAATRVIEV